MPFTFGVMVEVEGSVVVLVGNENVDKALNDLLHRLVEIFCLNLLKVDVF